MMGGALFQNLNIHMTNYRNQQLIKGSDIYSYSASQIKREYILYIYICIIYTILALKRTHCVYRYWVGFPPH